MDFVLLTRLIIGASASFLIGVTFVVVMNYYIAWRKRGPEPWSGLLPAHVLSVSLSYNLLLIYTTISSLIRTREGGSLTVWKVVLVAAAIVLGYVAMYTITKLRLRGGLKENEKFTK